MMAEYIEREALLTEIAELHMKHKLADNEEMLFTETDIQGLVMCLPTAEVEPVMPELRKAVKLLGKNYERGLSSDYVRNPVAWALYQTWKEMDGGADNEK